MPAPSLFLSKISAGGAEGRAACAELKKIIDDAGGVIDKLAKKLTMSRRSVFRLLNRAELIAYATKAREKSLDTLWCQRRHTILGQVCDRTK